MAREAESYGAAYPEGQGPGLRYTAFDRHASTRPPDGRAPPESQRALAAFRAGLKPLDPTEQQLRGFRQVFDAIPWSDVRETLHAEVELPAVPAYSDFVDRAASGQEDLVIAFTELFTAPTSRHVLAFTLAAFIDLIVFLLAYASGPFFFGAPEARWVAAAAALDAVDEQVFVRGPAAQDRGRAHRACRASRPRALSPGERQLVPACSARAGWPRRSTRTAGASTCSTPRPPEPGGVAGRAAAPAAGAWPAQPAGG